MDSNRKYLGMTIPQLGVLAGLASALLLILCVGGYLVFAGAMNAASPRPILPTVNPTATLIITPTATFTPAPTLIPYEQLIPKGWTQHLTPLVELWMPPSYKISKLPVPDGAALYAQTALVLSQPTSSKNLYSEWAFVTFEPLTQNSLDDFLDLRIQSLPAEVRVVERRKVILNGVEAIRVLSETRVSNIDFNGLDFVFLDGDTIWYVSFLAQINDFYNELPTFEQTALTFRLVK